MAMKNVVVESRLNDRFMIESDIRGHRVVIDQPAEAGGGDAGPTPLELLFASLAGCIGSIGRIVAMQRRIDLKGMRVKVEGGLDTDGLLGKPLEGRVGFGGITVTVDVDAEMSEEEKNDFVREVDQRCPVSENLMNETPVEVRLA